MNRIILTVIGILILITACRKEQNDSNPLSGKIKRTYYYDSLNILQETTDYVYDARGKLYMYKSNLKRIQLFVYGDTLALFIKQVDTTTLDSTTISYYAYLNNQGNIGRIDYVDSTNTRQFEREYQTNTSGILETVLLEPTGTSNKLIDFVYSNGNYTQYKMYYRFNLPFPPYSEVKDTITFNYEYNTIQSDLFPVFTSTHAFDNYFNYFGYKNSVSNSQLIRKFYNTGQTDTTYLNYQINSKNQIIEYTNHTNNRLMGRYLFEYY